ncbi:hypothetical protein VB10N_12500 [Vibrio sp. 10N]|nr:hypothetical protein VB10N_12500 [Vibrio sp. 10N]
MAKFIFKKDFSIGVENSKQNRTGVTLVEMQGRIKVDVLFSFKKVDYVFVA